MLSQQQLIEQLISEFRHKLKQTEAPSLTKREAKFTQAPNKIKVAIGMRRTGKTTFLFQQMHVLLEQNISSTQILYLNFEDDRLLPLDQQTLASLVDAFYSLFPENHNKKCYLFFDEIQNVPGWSLVIRRLFDTKNIELFLTGSSAKLLSKEIASNLRGRSLATEIWPYSFDEFISAKHYQVKGEIFDQQKRDFLSSYFSEYLKIGGLPEVTHYNTEDWQRTLQDYIDVVIYRDIIERHNVKNIGVIKYLILSLLKSSASTFSINKFYNDLKSQGHKIAKDTLYEYVNYVEDAFLSFSVPLFDSSIRKTQANPKKIYSIDSGIVRATTLDFQRDFGKLFENIIYLDLRRKKYQIYYYLTKERYEVDFLAIDLTGEKKLFQVAWDVSDSDTLAREERALKKAEEELGIKGKIITLESYLKDRI